MSRRFAMVDVFGRKGFTGNPVAVIDGQGLDTATMQSITRWLNLSETTFLLPPTRPGADYRVRIFSLERELPFAGHPTLGTCHAWLEAGGKPASPNTIVQECEAGLVSIRRAEGMLAFAAPPLVRSGPVDEADLAEAAAVLRIAPEAIVDAQWVDNGPGWLGVMLASADAVLAVEPAASHHRRIDVGLVGAHRGGGDAAFELRAFFNDQHGAIREDPVTGSLNASVAQWLFASGRAKESYMAAQGTRLGREGRIAVTRDEAGTVWVAGATRTHVQGAAAGLPFPEFD